MELDQQENKEMVTRISAKEFHNTGLMLVVNSILHTFGLAICYDPENDVIYPARCRYRGFSEKSINKSNSKIYNYLSKNLSELEGDLDE